MPKQSSPFLAGIAAAHHQRTVEIWPDNAPVFDLFCSISTQWRQGPSGPSGLDYNILYQDLDRLSLTADEYAEWKRDIKVMECAALEAIHKKE